MRESQAVNIAETQEELEAIYRFRYHVYIPTPITNANGYETIMTMAHTQ